MRIYPSTSKTGLAVNAARLPATLHPILAEAAGVSRLWWREEQAFCLKHLARTAAKNGGRHPELYWADETSFTVTVDHRSRPVFQLSF